VSEIQTRQKAEVLAAEALGYLEVVEGYVLENVDELHAAEELLKLVKGKLKFIEDEKKISTAQLAEEKKRIDAEKKRIEGFFAPATERYKTMETRLKDMVGHFVLAQEAKRRELAAAATKANTIQEKAALVRQAGDTTTPSHVAGVTTRVVLAFEVTDPDAVPRNLCTPDEGLIKRAIDAGQKDIPGVRVFEKVITSSRSA
jgi:uncharacterized membrane-anchored protein YhcB (DUF1043 family)